MFKKENVIKLFAISVAFAIVININEAWLSHSSFCDSWEGWCPKIVGFLRIAFIALLSLSSVFFVRLITSDSVFSSWKKFMKYFAAFVFILWLTGSFTSGHGSIGISMGGSRDNVIATVVIYILGSIILIVRQKLHEKRQEK